MTTMTAVAATANQWTLAHTSSGGSIQVINNSPTVALLVRAGDTGSVANTDATTLGNMTVPPLAERSLPGLASGDIVLIRPIGGDNGQATIRAYNNPNVSVSTGDIEIGAVEIKNDSDDTRVKVTANNAMKVAPTGNAVTKSSISGTITTGGQAQQISASNSARMGFMLQNQSDKDLYFSTLTAAVLGQPSLKLEPGQAYESPSHGVPTGAISIIGATTGQTFAGREW